MTKDKSHPFDLNHEEAELICVVLGAYAASLMTDPNITRTTMERHFHKINDLIQRLGKDQE